LTYHANKAQIGGEKHRYTPLAQTQKPEDRADNISIMYVTWRPNKNHVREEGEGNMQGPQSA